MCCVNKFSLAGVENVNENLVWLSGAVYVYFEVKNTTLLLSSGGNSS